MSDQPPAGSAPMPPPPDSGPVSRGQAPSTVVNAVRLMYVSAALSLVSMVVVFFTKDALEDSLRKADPQLSDARIEQALNAGLVFAVVFGIIFTVLWLVLASFVRKGANWARIVTWVLAGLSVLSVVFLFGQPPLNLVLGLVGVLVSIAIIVLLALKPSSEYFSARPS